MEKGHKQAGPQAQSSSHCSASIAHLFHIFNNKKNASRYQFPRLSQTFNELISNRSTRHKKILLSFFEGEAEIYQKSQEQEGTLKFHLYLLVTKGRDGDT